MAFQFIAFKISPEKAATLKKLATKDDRTMSSYIRKIIDTHLKSIKKSHDA